MTSRRPPRPSPGRARPDGARPAEDLSTLRRFMPLTMPTRTSATLFFHLPVDVGDTLRWLEADAGRDYRFFHVFCAAVVRTLAERPQLNRYVLDGVIYQRDAIALSFAVKKGFRDDAALEVVKVVFSPDDGLADVRERVDAAIAAARDPTPSALERRMASIDRLPRRAARGFLAAIDALDRRGLLPAKVLAEDPTHASALVTHLGSLGLDASFHHLSDHGSSSLVVALGRVAPRPHALEDGSLVARDTADIKIALDDRVVDGFYCARSLARFEHHLRHPQALVPRRDAPTDTIPGRLFDLAHRHPERPAHYDRAGGAWSATTWFTVAEAVRSVARALIALGVQPGDRVVLRAGNRSEWCVFHLAALTIGAISGSAHDDAPPDELAHILRDAAPRTVLVEDAAAVRLVRETLGDDIDVVLVRDAPHDASDRRVHGWVELTEAGRALDDDRVDRRLRALRPSDPAVLVYTSGTTGRARGAMLTHDNLAWTARTCAGLFGGGPDDRTVSYLPLSHIAEQMFTVYVPISTGAAVYFATLRHAVLDDLREVQPTVVFGVPRVWRRLADDARRVLDALRAERGRWVVERAIAVAERWVDARESGEVSPGLRLAWRAARSAVVDEARRRLGLARAREGITGAAALDADTVARFRQLGLLLRETYGQTEGSGPTTFQVRGRTRPGTVGAPIPGVEVRLEGREILARGRNVFAGYWRDEAATAAALRDGWLVTGDEGALEPDGALRLTGRSKELLVTDGGENVAPAALEASLESLDLVDQAVVVGDARPYLGALLTLDVDACVTWLARRGEAPDGPLSRDPRVREALGVAIDAWNTGRARHERVRRFEVLDAPLTAEHGDLTATLKLRRRVIGERYAAAIHRLYDEPTAPPRSRPRGAVEIGGFVAEPVDDEATLDAAFALRHRSFSRAGHLTPGAWPDGRLRDEVDDDAIQFVVRDRVGELVGTVRLALPEHGLPVQALFRFPPVSVPPDRVGEIGRLAIDARWRDRRAPLRALVEAILQHGSARGLTHFYAFVPARAVRAYRALGYTTWEIACDPPTAEMVARRARLAPYFQTQDPRVIVFTTLPAGAA